MGSEPGHEGDVASTKFPNMLQQDERCEAALTYVDSANPVRFLLGTECSPFPPYRWVCTAVRTKHTWCRPKKGQSNGKEVVDQHIWQDVM